MFLSLLMFFSCFKALENNCQRMTKMWGFRETLDETLGKGAALAKTDVIGDGKPSFLRPSPAPSTVPLID
jgi:hypothetical protein